MLEPKMSKTYFDKNGTLQYAVKDENEKCFSQTCNIRTGTSDEKSGADVQIGDSTQGVVPAMSCRTSWWTNGYWNNWWGWGGNWGVYGDNLTYLYTEIDAPEAYRCGNIDNCYYYNPYDPYYSWWNYWWYSLDCEDMQASSCARPRIARCKTYGCVSDYNSYYSGYNCDIVNGKDREIRCCKAPSNFECKEGECDYDYEIVKKEYTVEYELVRPAYSCIEKYKYPKTSCVPHTSIPSSNIFCEQNITECSTDPEAKCETGYNWWFNGKCPENPEKPKEGYEKEISTSTSVVSFWELDDCNCGYNKDSGYYSCPSCYKCEDFEDCNYDLRASNNGWYWNNYGFGGYIGDDCCNSGYWGWGWWGYWGFGPCPIDAGDGSENPWWCDGSECMQKASGEELETDSGPYTTYLKCMENCLKDEKSGSTNKCIADSKSYTRGYCCDTNFIEQMQNNIKNGCYEEGPKYTKNTKEKICSADVCSNDLIVERGDDMCTYSTKYCPSHKVTQTNTGVLYTYDPPIQEKAYNRICNDCEKASNDECEKDPESKCPANTELPLLRDTKKYFEDEVLETQTITLTMVFCKITIKECAN